MVAHVVYQQFDKMISAYMAAGGAIPENAEITCAYRESTFAFKFAPENGERFSQTAPASRSASVRAAC